jgi:DNA-binding transcriptional LysR family regulator
MEWDDLKYFLEVARLSTLTKAAHALRTTPATVARRIARLEAKLSARLFDRKYTGYQLTEVGKSFLVKTEEVEAAILSMVREVLGRDAQPSGKVRLTTTEDIATLVIGPHLDAFAHRFPEIQLEISSGRDVLSLARGEADIAMRTVRPARGGLVIRQAGWWNLALYAAKSYAQAHNLHPPVTDLSGADLVTWTKEFAHLRGGPWFGEHARDAKIALSANSRRVHHAACRAGLGIAILPCLLADDDQDLIRLLPPERVISTKLWLVVHPDISRIPRVRAVMDFLAKIGPKGGR